MSCPLHGCCGYSKGEGPVTVVNYLKDNISSNFALEYFEHYGSQVTGGVEPRSFGFGQLFRFVL